MAGGRAVSPSAALMPVSSLSSRAASSTNCSSLPAARSLVGSCSGGCRGRQEGRRVSGSWLAARRSCHRWQWRRQRRARQRMFGGRGEAEAFGLLGSEPHVYLVCYSDPRLPLLLRLASAPWRCSVASCIEWDGKGWCPTSRLGSCRLPTWCQVTCTPSSLATIVFSPAVLLLSC